MASEQTNNDFLSQFLVPAGPEAKEIRYKGQTGTAYFKRITAGQRAQLLKGQRVQRRADEGTTIDVDIGESMINKHRMVHFSCCFEDGRQRFKSVGDVQAADALLIEELYRAASEVNEEDDEGEDAQGKS